MCKVNSGEQIQNRQDVQNLVTAIIFRQSGEYRIDDIVKIVSHYMKGSRCEISDDNLYYIILDTLDMLYIRNRIKCRHGIYAPLPLKVLSAQYCDVYN